MACTEPRLTALKIAHKGELHRLRVDLSVFHHADLMALFAETFSLAPNSFVVQYNDTEGDLLNVTSEAEYTEACRVFLQGADSVKSLRFSAVSLAHVAFQANVTDPILKAIEKLVATLNAAMEKVKQEQWAQRAQTAAQSGVEHTSEAFTRAAQDARESLYAARESIKQIPFDQMIKGTTEGLKSARQSIQEIPVDRVLASTTEGLKVAAEGVTAFANEMANDLKKFELEIPADLKATADGVAAYANEIVAEIKNFQLKPQTEPAEVVPQPPSEPGWEQVEQQSAQTVVETAPEPALTLEEAPVVVVAEPELVAVVVSKEERKWAVELTMVRDVFPGVETQHVIDCLEQCSGNVQVVLNALVEEM